jgi:hypothetical protein
MIGARVLGLNLIEDALFGIEHRLERDVPKLLVETAQGCLTDSQALAPVETGFMRDSGHVVVVKPTTVEVRYEAPYSLWVEEGHHTADGSFVPPQHFLLPPFMVYSQRLQKQFQDMLK